MRDELRDVTRGPGSPLFAHNNSVREVLIQTAQAPHGDHLLADIYTEGFCLHYL